MSTATEHNTVRTSTERLLGGTAGVAVGLFLGLVALLHLLRTDYVPVNDPISAYAVGDYGVLMTVAFLANAVAFLALAVAVGRTGGVRSGPISWLLAVAGVGMAVAAIAETDVPVVTPPSPVGAVHALSALTAFLCLTVAALLSLRPLRDRPGLHAVARVLAITAVPTFVAFLGLTFTESAGAGLVQRILTVLLLSWVLIQARSVASGTATH